MPVNSLPTVPLVNTLQTIPEAFTHNTKYSFDTLVSTNAGSGCSCVGFDDTNNSDFGDSVQEVLDNSISRKPMVFSEQVYLDGLTQYTNEVVLSVMMHDDGCILGSSIYAYDARTAGSLSLLVQVNGVALANTSLNLTLDGSATQKDSAETAYNTAGFTYTAGDTIGFLMTTTSFAPLDTSLMISLLARNS